MGVICELLLLVLGLPLEPLLGLVVAWSPWPECGSPGELGRLWWVGYEPRPWTVVVGGGKWWPAMRL